METNKDYPFFQDDNDNFEPAMLNIFTPLFRLGNIKTVSDSIPKQNDINHIIVISKHRDDLIKECKSLKLKYITIEEPDSIESVSIKVNAAIKSITTGYFFGLDDDTIFNENTYKLYKQNHCCSKLPKLGC